MESMSTNLSRIPRPVLYRIIRILFGALHGRMTLQGREGVVQHLTAVYIDDGWSGPLRDVIGIKRP